MYLHWKWSTGFQGTSGSDDFAGSLLGNPAQGKPQLGFLHAADNMLYRVKKFSRNNYCVGGLDETEDVTMGTAL